jgi:hypothetical protein
MRYCRAMKVNVSMEAEDVKMLGFALLTPTYADQPLIVDLMRFYC